MRGWLVRASLPEARKRFVEAKRKGRPLQDLRRRRAGDLSSDPEQVHPSVPFPFARGCKGSRRHENLGPRPLAPWAVTRSNQPSGER
jgi:hypothetical protein